jgi:hypothetical protein
MSILAMMAGTDRLQELLFRRSACAPLYNGRRYVAAQLIHPSPELLADFREQLQGDCKPFEKHIVRRDTTIAEDVKLWLMPETFMPVILSRPEDSPAVITLLAMLVTFVREETYRPVPRDLRHSAPVPNFTFQQAIARVTASSAVAHRAYTVASTLNAICLMTMKTQGVKEVRAMTVVAHDALSFDFSSRHLQMAHDLILVHEALLLLQGAARFAFTLQQAALAHSLLEKQTKTNHDGTLDEYATLVNEFAALCKNFMRCQRVSLPGSPLRGDDLRKSPGNVVEHTRQCFNEDHLVHTEHHDVKRRVTKYGWCSPLLHPRPKRADDSGRGLPVKPLAPLWVLWSAESFSRR